MTDPKMVEVTRAELDKLCADLGLPAGSTVEAMLARAAELRAAEDAHKAKQEQSRQVAAAQRYNLDEDKRIVAAAINDGRVPVERRQFWLDAMARDRDRTRQLVANLSPGLRPAAQLVEDESLERTHGSVLRRLGVAPDTARPRPVQAAAPPAPRPPVVRYDDLGLPIPQAPEPVMLRRGVNPADYNSQQQGDHFLSILGGRFKAGANSLPAGDAYYYPGPNDHSRPVFGPDGTLTGWEDNPDYRPQG